MRQRAISRTVPRRTLRRLSLRERVERLEARDLRIKKLEARVTEIETVQAETKRLLRRIDQHVGNIGEGVRMGVDCNNAIVRSLGEIRLSLGLGSDEFAEGAAQRATEWRATRAEGDG